MHKAWIQLTLENRLPHKERAIYIDAEMITSVVDRVGIDEGCIVALSDELHTVIQSSSYVVRYADEAVENAYKEEE